MKTYNCLTILLGCLLLMPRLPVLAQTNDVVVGVNLENNPDRLTPQQQDALLDAMKNSGVKIIRAGIAGDGNVGIDFAQRVYAYGMKILWLAGVKAPAACCVTKLSADDPDQFRAYFQPLFDKLESKRIVFAGIELGSEINWNNSDLNYTGGGRILRFEDLNRAPEGQQVASGYLKYIKVLAALKDIRDHSKLNQRTPIISAGLAPFSPPNTGQKRDAVDITATLHFLRANGADQFVDGYGIHWYPQGNASPAARLSDLRQTLTECGSASNGGKPCWITEWGLPVSSGKSCPVVDVKRTAIFSELRNDFSQMQDRLKGIMFYTWQGNIHDEDPYSAFLCGALTKSGQLAIAPM
jgi:hypothetical protein